MKRKPVRAPFVVTVAVLALPACGGRFESTPLTDAGVDAKSETLEPPSNPPPCPVTRPSWGGACDHPEDRSCFYDAPGCPSSMQEAWKCISNQWQNTSPVACNPPPVACPASPPTPGTSCGPGWGSCSYADACPHAPADARTTYVCNSGTWQKSTTTTYKVKCPALAPKDGEACLCAGRYESECKYFDCSGGPNTTARCNESTGKWEVSLTICNPPPPDAGLPPDSGGGEEPSPPPEPFP